MTEHECLSCKSLSGEKRISPAITIYQNASWTVEHAYPTGLPFWLVIVLREHKEAMHELNEAEFQDLLSIQKRAVKILRKLTGCKKEYIIVMCEGEGFQHLHVHIIPRAEDMPDEYKGKNIFKYLKLPKEKIVPEEKIKEICQQLAEEFKKRQ